MLPITPLYEIGQSVLMFLPDQILPDAGIVCSRFRCERGDLVCFGPGDHMRISDTGWYYFVSGGIFCFEKYLKPIMDIDRSVQGLLDEIRKNCLKWDGDRA